MRLLTYLIVFSNFYGGSQELFDILENYRINDDEKSARTIKNNFPRSSPIPYSDLDRSYLLRRHQERHGYNQGTRMPYNGLQKRANREFAESSKKYAMKEQKIKEAFGRKIKNKTYHKRHHSRNSNTY